MAVKNRPKGTKFKGSDGKMYVSLGGGKSQGVNNTKPKMKKTKKAGTVKTKKRKSKSGSSVKIKKTKMGGYTKK